MRKPGKARTQRLPSPQSGELWKLWELWKTLHSTPFHSEFPTVPTVSTAPATGFIFGTKPERPVRSSYCFVANGLGNRSARTRNGSLSRIAKTDGAGRSISLTVPFIEPLTRWVCPNRDEQTGPLSASCRLQHHRPTSDRGGYAQNLDAHPPEPRTRNLTSFVPERNHRIYFCRPASRDVARQERDSSQHHRYHGERGRITRADFKQ